jgi:hypothetical protein
MSTCAGFWLFLSSAPRLPSSCGDSSDIWRSLPAPGFRTELRSPSDLCRYPLVVGDACPPFPADLPHCNRRRHVRLDLAHGCRRQVAFCSLRAGPRPCEYPSDGTRDSGVRSAAKQAWPACVRTKIPRRQLSSPSRAALRSWVTNMAPTFTVRPATWRWCHRPPQLAAVRHRRMGRPRAATVTCFDPLCPLCPLVDIRHRFIGVLF